MFPIMHVPEPSLQQGQFDAQAVPHGAQLSLAYSLPLAVGVGTCPSTTLGSVCV